ncbi:protein-tyrosine phosphatase-like protein [Crepidotus variabilis]|uniref:protein-tyrosine-phosphatase n=1 Tax=Crepidotus variabilis TaxID=179855 RepID=A0A9P6JIQ4_9AGAR|nr:protein-tyrosine phosphatase-like protein [Crepidotus variabilis]
MPPKRKAQAATYPKQLSSCNAVSVIIPSALYLGPVSAATSTQFIASNGITQVLSIGITPSPKVDGVIYHRLSVNDSASASVIPTINCAVEIIDHALKSKKGTGRILVHCCAGVSRSPTLVVAYLMKKRGMSLRDALGHVVKIRPQVSPNSGFIQQLKDMEVELRGVSTLDVDQLPRRETDRLAIFADVVGLEGVPQG